MNIVNDLVISADLIDVLEVVIFVLLYNFSLLSDWESRYLTKYTFPVTYNGTDLGNKMTPSLSTGLSSSSCKNGLQCPFFP